MTSPAISFATVLCEVEPITVGRLVDRLEVRGPIKRRPDPADRRVKHPHLPPLRDRSQPPFAITGSKGPVLAGIAAATREPPERFSPVELLHGSSSTAGRNLVWHAACGSACHPIFLVYAIFRQSQRRVAGICDSPDTNSYSCGAPRASGMRYRYFHYKHIPRQGRANPSLLPCGRRLALGPRAGNRFWGDSHVRWFHAAIFRHPVDGVVFSRARCADADN